MPQAIHQAHERIIGERPVENGEKMLSLYEGHAAVYVRGKAGAEVEFGSQLWLGEAGSGGVVGWGLGEGQPRAGTKELGPSLGRVERVAAGHAILQVSAARGI